MLLVYLSRALDISRWFVIWNDLECGPVVPCPLKQLAVLLVAVPSFPTLSNLGRAPFLLACAIGFSPFTSVPLKTPGFDFVATYCYWFSDCASQTSSISTWELFRSENAGTPPWTFSERNFGRGPSNPVLTRRSSQMWEPLLLWYGKLHSERVTSLFPLLASLPRACQHVYLCPSILGLLQQHQLVP